MLEYGYYLSIFYSVMSPALGLSVGMIGAAFLAVLAVLCFMRVRATARFVYAPLIYPLICAICYLLIQNFVYGESILTNESRSFVTWMLALVIIQSLALRPGFLHRFAIALFLIGLIMLPYLELSGAPGEDRFKLGGGVAFGNPNDLAAFFGFCCLYFIIAGIEARRMLFRAACWLAAIVSLYVVGLTVSRGPLFAIAAAAVVGGRRLLKRGFIPILVLVLVAWLAYLSGLFDQTIASYQGRLTRETGRLSVWPLALERFWGSPWIGVGVSNLATEVPGRKPVTPHNGFLHVGLSSGLIPLLFFVAYWWQSGRAALSKAAQSSRDAPFHFPLWLYAFLITFQLGVAFMAPWSIAILGVAMSRGSGPRGVPASGFRRLHRPPSARQSNVLKHKVPHRHR